MGDANSMKKYLQYSSRNRKMVSTPNVSARCECISSTISKSGLNPVIISVLVSVATIHAQPKNFLDLLPSVTISCLTFDRMYWIRGFALFLSEKLDNRIFFHARKFAMWFLQVLEYFEVLPFIQFVFNNSTLFY